jgi:hypothetical protein
MDVDAFEKFAKDPAMSDDAVKEAFLNVTINAVEDIVRVTDALRTHRPKVYEFLERRMNERRSLL